MKKFICALLAGTLTFALTACTQNEQTIMSIKPGEFSPETQEVFEWFTDEVELFDISLDETAKSHKLSFWIYRDGEWTEEGNLCEIIDCSTGKIALRLTDSSYDLCFIDENSHAKYDCPTTETTFENSEVTGITKIDKETPIELNKELPVWVKLGTNANTLDMNINNDFRNIECSEGIAITLTVSDKILE